MAHQKSWTRGAMRVFWLAIIMLEEPAVDRPLIGVGVAAAELRRDPSCNQYPISINTYAQHRLMLAMMAALNTGCPLTVGPLNGPGSTLAAQLGGVNLSTPLDAACASAIVAAWNLHSVVLFRDQQLTEEAMLRVAKSFGAPKPAGSRGYYMRSGNPHGSGRVSPFPEVSVMSNLDADGNPQPVTGGHGSQAVDWHQDDSYTNRPAQGALLYNVAHPVDGGGNTTFCDLYRAYDSLDAETRRQIEHLHLVHDISRNSAFHVRPGLKLPATYDDVVGPAHPLVIVHPLTGRRALHLGRKPPAPTSYILEMPDAEGHELFARLWEHATRPDNTWTYSGWRPGDMLVWDNLATMHMRSTVDATQRREMLRVVLSGPDGLVGLHGLRTVETDANAGADAEARAKAPEAGAPGVQQQQCAQP